METKEKNKIIFITFNKLGYACLEEIIRSKRFDVARAYTLEPELTGGISDYQDLSPLCQKYQIAISYVKNINDQFEEIKKLNPDIIFVVGWSQFIKNELLEVPRLGCIGFHPALLPKNRGRAAIPWHFINEEKHGGATFFYLDQGCDSGNIICQGRFSLTGQDNAKTYYERMTKLSVQLLKKNLKKIAGGKFKGKKQNQSQATYLMIRNEYDSFLDFNLLATREVSNQVRAVAHIYPTAFAFYEKKKIFIYQAKIVPRQFHIYSATVGQLIKVLSDSLWVKTKDGIIELKEICDENNRPLDCLKYFKIGRHLNR